MQVDMPGYQAAMEAAREKSRAGQTPAWPYMQGFPVSILLLPSDHTQQSACVVASAFDCR